MSMPVYLDYNATAPMRASVKTLLSELHGKPLNPSSVHALGREGRKRVEQARRDVAALVGADSGNVIFNSGATETNNTVLEFFKGQRILVSAIEHPSILESKHNLEHIPVTKTGLVDLNALEDLLKVDRTALVSVMLVNNETGLIQPVADIAALAKKHGALVHCDAVQAAGRVPVNIADLGVDFMSLSAHKLGGPQGVGALVTGVCGQVPVLLHGGGQEKQARAGTENVAGIAGFGQAAHEALEDLQTFQAFAKQRNAMEAEIAKITPEVVFYGQDQMRVSNTSLFSLPGVKSETLLMALDLEGICISNGSACTSGKVEPSHVLLSMGKSQEEASSVLRVSMGWDTVPEDIAAFLKAWETCTGRIRKT